MDEIKLGDILYYHKFRFQAGFKTVTEYQVVNIGETPKHYIVLKKKNVMGVGKDVVYLSPDDIGEIMSGATSSKEAWSTRMDDVKLLSKLHDYLMERKDEEKARLLRLNRYLDQVGDWIDETNAKAQDTGELEKDELEEVTDISMAVRNEEWLRRATIAMGQKAIGTRLVNSLKKTDMICFWPYIDMERIFRHAFSNSLNVGDKTFELSHRLRRSYVNRYYKSVPLPLKYYLRFSATRLAWFEMRRIEDKEAFADRVFQILQVKLKKHELDEWYNYSFEEFLLQIGQDEMIDKQWLLLKKSYEMLGDISWR